LRFVLTLARHRGAKLGRAEPVRLCLRAQAHPLENAGPFAKRLRVPRRQLYREVQRVKCVAQLTAGKEPPGGSQLLRRAPFRFIEQVFRHASDGSLATGGMSTNRYSG
jgi:hypothetical protein